MCGASQQQKDLSTEQTAFYKQMESQDATTFKENQDILNQVKSAYAPILAGGPNQMGYSTSQLNALNTQATEGVATDYAGASKALRENQAAAGGGDTYLSSGVSAQQNASLASASAQQESSDKLNILTQGYQQGYDEFKQATSALEGASSENDSVNYANAANSAGSDASKTDNDVTNANESWMTPLAGAVGAVGGAATAGFMKH